MPVSDLISRHAEAWRAATAHPFLHAVGTGELPAPAFHAWLGQDAIFVADLLRFQARLLATAPRADQAVLAAGLVALEAELTWFELHARRLGQSTEPAAHPATLAYRAHLEALERSPYAARTTALWTLERAYLEAWRVAAPGAPAFREFVEHWTAPGFAEYVEGLEATVREPDEAAFLGTVRLERDFWEMTWASAAS